MRSEKQSRAILQGHVFVIYCCGTINPRRSRSKERLLIRSCCRSEIWVKLGWILCCRISHRLQFRCWQEQGSSEGSRRSHIKLICTVVANIQFFVVFSVSALLGHGATLMEVTDFCNLITEVRSHYFYLILFVRANGQV